MWDQVIECDILQCVSKFKESKRYIPPREWPVTLIKNAFPQSWRFVEFTWWRFSPQWSLTVIGQGSKHEYSLEWFTRKQFLAKVWTQTEWGDEPMRFWLSGALARPRATRTMSIGGFEYWTVSVPAKCVCRRTDKNVDTVCLIKVTERGILSWRVDRQRKRNILVRFQGILAWAVSEGAAEWERGIGQARTRGVGSRMLLGRHHSLCFFLSRTFAVQDWCAPRILVLEQSCWHSTSSQQQTTLWLPPFPYTDFSLTSATTFGLVFFFENYGFSGSKWFPKAINSFYKINKNMISSYENWILLFCLFAPKINSFNRNRLLPLRLYRCKVLLCFQQIIPPKLVCRFPTFIPICSPLLHVFICTYSVQQKCLIYWKTVNLSLALPTCTKCLVCRKVPITVKSKQPTERNHWKSIQIGQPRIKRKMLIKLFKLLPRLVSWALFLQ